MFVMVRFKDDKPIIKKFKEASDADKFVDEMKEEYNLKQVGAVRSGPGIIFSATKKPKYIWE